MSEIKITGMDEVRRALKQIPPKLAQRVTQTAIRQGANYMLREIRAAAPVSAKGSQEVVGKNGKKNQYQHFPPGRLRKAIKVKQSKINRLTRNGVVGLYITIDPGKKRSDPRGAWYGKFVEVGYNKGSKAVTGRQAVRLGIVSRETLEAKKRFVASKRKFGRYKQGIRYRHGGTRVEGQHFVLNTFNRTAEQTGRIVAAGIEQAFKQTAQHLGFKTSA